MSLLLVVDSLYGSVIAIDRGRTVQRECPVDLTAVTACLTRLQLATTSLDNSIFMQACASPEEARRSYERALLSMWKRAVVDGNAEKCTSTTRENGKRLKCEVAKDSAECIDSYLSFA